MSVQSGKPIDFEKALQYPLSPVPLSLCNADGTMRKTNKCDLMKLILQSTNNAEAPKIKEQNSVYIIDLMAAIRTVREIPDTFQDLAFKIIKSIPTGYKRVDIVADSYWPNSIKTSERTKRGLSEKILIKSSKAKIPREFSKFLSSSENKKRMIELLFDVFEKNCVKMLNLIKSNKLVISMEDSCRSLTLSAVEDVQCLTSNQEEADTKIFLHCAQILKENDTDIVVVRSPSGDTDILVLATALLTTGERVFIDNGTGQNRKLIWLGNIEFSVSRRNALIGFHAFTGNDYNASFFKKGKVKCWKTFINNSKFEDMFASLGDHQKLDNTLISQLEEYVCYLYGYREKSVDSVRYKMFEKKRLREHKIPDLSTFPPCKQVLRYHSSRSNAIAFIWKQSLINNIDFPNVIECGWCVNSDIHWIDDSFPSQVEDILFDNSVNSDDEDFGSDVESDDDDEFEEFLNK